jgi:hypothetical protein
MLWPNEFIERARTHAVGQRARAQKAGVFGRDGLE